MNQNQAQMSASSRLQEKKIEILERELKSLKQSKDHGKSNEYDLMNQNIAQLIKMNEQI